MLFKKNHPFIFYMLIFFLGIGLVGIGGYYYVRHTIVKMLEEKHLALSLEDYKVQLQGFQLPALTFNKVKVISHDKKNDFKQIDIEKAIFKPKKIGFNKFKVNFELLNAKIIDYKSNYTEAGNISGEISKKSSLYSLKDFCIEPLHLGLTDEYATPLQRGEDKKYDVVFVVLYKILANGHFNQKNNELQFQLTIPPAQVQMPAGTTYSLDSKGDLKLLTDNSSPSREKGSSHTPKANIPCQGKVLFTIDHISNFLRHLHQIRVISFIETVIGQILSPGFITKNLAPGHIPDESKEQVKIEMKVDKQAVYLGKFKVYP